VTVTHTASVFAMGFLALAIERYVGSEKLLRTLELSSGALVAAVALSQLPERLRRMQGAFAPKPVAHDHDHAHHHDHAHDHDHGHSHALPEELTLRSLVALGVSGGIVPCPGALVVLLAAIGLHQVAFGLAMLVAFSMGLATVLSAIGLVFVLARSRFERLSTDGRLLRALPVLSSCAVLVLGVVIAVRALVK
jgi:ABC-type nickel/cobalt efflux system permease component RcnA